jgi:hypothetical protein
MNKTKNLNRSEKLTILAKHLIEVVCFEKKEFSIKDWIYTHDCGTAGCAVGYAMQMPIFNELGFSYHAERPSYNGKRDWEAVQCFFDLTFDQSQYLFYGPQYPNCWDTTAEEVAFRIFEFIEENPEINCK